MRERCSQWWKWRSSFWKLTMGSPATLMPSVTVEISLWNAKRVTHGLRYEMLRITHGLPEGPLTWMPLMSLFVEHQPKLPGGTGALEPLQVLMLISCCEESFEDDEPWFVSAALVDDSFIGERKAALASLTFSSNRKATRSICRPSPWTCWKSDVIALVDLNWTGMWKWREWKTTRWLLMRGYLGLYNLHISDRCSNSGGS